MGCLCFHVLWGGCAACSQFVPNLPPALRSIRRSSPCNCICGRSTGILYLQCSTEMQSLGLVSARNSANSSDPVSASVLCWALGCCQTFSRELSSPHNSGVDNRHGSGRNQTEQGLCSPVGAQCTLQWQGPHPWTGGACTDGFFQVGRRERKTTFNDQDGSEMTVCQWQSWTVDSSAQVR